VKAANPLMNGGSGGCGRRRAPAAAGLGGGDGCEQNHIVWMAPIGRVVRL